MTDRPYPYFIDKRPVDPLSKRFQIGEIMMENDPEPKESEACVQQGTLVVNDSLVTDTGVFDREVVDELMTAIKEMAPKVLEEKLKDVIGEDTGQTSQSRPNLETLTVIAREIELWETSPCSSSTSLINNTPVNKIEKKISFDFPDELERLDFSALHFSFSSSYP